MRQRQLTLLSALCVLLGLERAHAQCYDWVHTFRNAGLNDNAAAQAVFDDGNGPALYVGGEFTTADQATVNRIARFDGTTWSALGAGVGGLSAKVNSLAVFDDGSGPALYATGQFSTAGGAPANNIARWNGTSWSALGNGLTPSGTVSNQFGYALAAFDDGSGPALYVGGSFGTAGSVTTSNIAKWNGTSWSAVGAPTGANQPVNALEVFDSGGGAKLYAGGQFASIGGVSAPYLAAWNGSTWTAVPGVATQVAALEVHDDGTGNALYASVLSGGLVQRWSGTALTTLPSIGFNSPLTMLSFDDGVQGRQLYANTFNSCRRWDGAGWFDVGPPHAFNFNIKSLIAFDSGSGSKLYAAGQFTQVTGVYAAHFATWDGSSWGPSADSAGFDGSVLALEVFDGGSGDELYIGGAFTYAGGHSALGIVRWDGTTWTNMGDLINSSVVNAFAKWDDGHGEALYAGGNFTYAAGVHVNEVARWNGSSWSALGAGVANSAGSAVYALAVFDDGSGEALYAGGHFQTFGGGHIAKWNGTSWSALSSGLDKEVKSLAVFDDGSGPRLFVGGGFMTAGGLAARRIAAWDGASWSAVGSGMPGTQTEVTALAVFDDGSGPALYAGGYFTTAGGTPVNDVARWDGTSWTAVGTGFSAPVKSLRVLDDGSGAALYATGYFGLAGSVVVNHIARWDGVSWAPLRSGLNNTTYSLAVFDPGSGPALFVGGDFSTAGGMSSTNLAGWARACTCPPVSYCTAGTSSNGCAPSIGASGTPSASGSGSFVVTASGVEGQKLGLLFYGLSGATAAPWGTTTSTLCVKPPQQRTGQLNSGGTSGACDGSLVLDWNAYVASHAGALGQPFHVGDTVRMQGWYRDPPNAKTTSLTDALEFALCP